MPEYLVITGMSGAGRSQAGATLEDLGWFVIDNMPTSLVAKVAELVSAPGSAAERVAFVVGRTAESPDELRRAVAALRSTGAPVRVVYLDASDEVLVRRYEGTRRRHPFGAEGVAGAIDSERTELRATREQADVLIDTTELNVHQLRERLAELFAAPDAEPMQLSVVSFGFKHGVPRDVDDLLDVRFLPNPHWVEELRPLTGLDAPVRDYVLAQPEAKELLARLEDLFGFLLPAYVKEGKSYLTIALGCTGGRHRSVALAEELAGRLRASGWEPTVHHRDLDRSA